MNAQFWKRSDSFQPLPTTAEHTTSAMIPAAKSQLLLDSSVVPQSSRVLWWPIEPIATRDGAMAPTISVSVMNAIDTSTLTVNQNEEIRPTTGWIVRPTST